MPGFLKRAIALLCVLTLVFPLISDDDDLLQQQMASDADAVSILIKVCGDCKDYIGGLSTVLPAVFARPALIGDNDCTSGCQLPRYRSAEAYATGDRSPPRL
jgi:hypothetical protein